ncbi:MAG: hypothetical protein A2126_04080 [Candidatus Woykebacteria bacterium GWB1_45_5]|uniref:ABC3 transporter permease protein domain-containing protein n=2 Tax=Candidatus Woykeibacteriota TaxID=1817899 RepID=A0A1G1W1D1_9BACT|nr:MAG: hypothetical protein A2113_01885 [Candidatus Woykebacteria bacterium GWA1_44_8]OGY22326.1 MAG: hypothetical protein A2126_04080 [Candidatus Woykebacteria bacterium GWB1_45_5]
MSFFDYFRISFRNLSRRKLRSFLTIVAVVIGSIAVLSLLTLSFSASGVFKKQLEAVGALTQVMVTQQQQGGGGPFGGGEGDDTIQTKKLDDTVVADLKKIDNVVAVSPSMGIWNIASVSLQGQTKKFNIRLQAYEPNEASVKQLVAGRNLEKGEKNKVIINSAYLKRFGFSDKNPQEILGKKVVLTTQGGFTGIGVDVPKPPMDNKDWWEEQRKITYDLPAEVVGVEEGFGGDQNGVYITLDWGKDLNTQRYWKTDEEAMEKLKQSGKEFKEPSMILVTDTTQEKEKGYEAVVLKVRETKDSKAVGEAVRKMGFGAQTAQDILDQFNKMFFALSLILGAIGGISLGVAAIGIINTMVMATYERTREIGVMRACGATKGTIRTLFTFEAGLLGFWGGVIGVGIIMGVAIVGNMYVNKLLTQQNIPLQNIIAPPPWLILGVIAFTTLLGLISGLYPAFRASRLNPVDALRYE